MALVSMTDKEKQEWEDRLNKHKDKEELAYVTRSLGWRWPTVTIFFLTFTCAVIGWVSVSHIMASKDVRIEEIKSHTTLEQARINK